MHVSVLLDFDSFALHVYPQQKGSSTVFPIAMRKEGIYTGEIFTPRMNRRNPFLWNGVKDPWSFLNGSALIDCAVRFYVSKADLGSKNKMKEPIKWQVQHKSD